MNGINGRLTGIFAILFVLMMFVGVLIGFNTPDADEPDQAWIDWINDSDKHWMAIAGGYLIVLSGIAFLVFIVGLHRRLRAAEGNDGSVSLLMLVMGIGWAICLMSGAILATTLAGGIEFGEATDPSPEVARWIDQIGFGVLLVAGGMCAAGMSAVSSWLILRTKSLPAWLGYLGFVAALAMVLAAFFVPLLVFAVWMLAMGVVLLMTKEEPEPAGIAA